MHPGGCGCGLFYILGGDTFAGFVFVVVSSLFVSASILCVDLLFVLRLR